MRSYARLNINAIKRLAARFPKVVRQETIGRLQVVVTRMEKETVERTPMGVGGGAGLAGSIFGEVIAPSGTKVKGIVGTPLEYGEVVELGRRPGKGMPPVEPIALWAQRKLGVEAKNAMSAGFAIARKIQVKGTKGAKMFARAWAANKSWMVDQLNSIAERVTRRLNK